MLHSRVQSTAYRARYSCLHHEDSRARQKSLYKAAYTAQHSLHNTACTGQQQSLYKTAYTGQQSLHKTAYTAKQRHVDMFPDHTFYVSRPHLLCIKNRIEDRQSNRRSTIENRQSNRRSTIEKRNRIMSYLALHRCQLHLLHIIQNSCKPLCGLSHSDNYISEGYVLTHLTHQLCSHTSTMLFVAYSELQCSLVF